MNLKKIGTVLTSKFVVTGPSSYEKTIYRAAVSQRLRNTNLEDPGVDGKIIILRCIFMKCDVGVWTGSSWLRIGTGGGHL